MEAALPTQEEAIGHQCMEVGMKVEIFTGGVPARVGITIPGIPSGRPMLAPWVLFWIPDVQVLAPKSLCDRITQKLKEGLERQKRINLNKTDFSLG